MEYFDPTTVATLRGVFRLVVPEAVLAAFACVLFLGSTVRGGRSLWGTVALVGLAAAAVGLGLTYRDKLPAAAATVSSVWPDSFTLLVRVIALAGGAGSLSR